MDTWHYQTSSKHCMKTFNVFMQCFDNIKHHCYLHFMWELEGSSRWKVESPDRIKHYQISPTSSKYHQTLSDIIKYHYQTCKTGIGGAGAEGNKTFERNFWNVSFLEGGEQGGKRSKIWWSSWSRIGSWQGVGKKPPRTSSSPLIRIVVKPYLPRSSLHGQVRLIIFGWSMTIGHHCCTFHCHPHTCL